jgi:hypothetical protein
VGTRITKRWVASAGRHEHLRRGDRHRIIP